MTEPTYDQIDDAQRLLNGDMRSFLRAYVPDGNIWDGLEDNPSTFDPHDDRPSTVRAVVENETPDVFTRGGSFVLDAPDVPPAIWGRDDHVIWAEGEAFMLAAPQGVGKTTVALQLVRAMLGLQDDVLGYPVRPTERRVLFLAMDRPAQMRRAAGRIFTEDDRLLLDEKLVIWHGPPPYDMAQRKDMLAVMGLKAKADVIVVDSLKDAAIGLSEDAVGAGYNRTRQQALAEGFQVCELHHMVKRGPGGAEPSALADVYGSTWLTSGAGSVVSLWGEAGDPVVKWRHLKQPLTEVGPFHVSHDHTAGVSTVESGPDLLSLVRRTGISGLSPSEYACALFEAVKPTRAQTEKARRLLDKKVAAEVLTVVASTGRGNSARYFLRSDSS
jgi:DNA polymerase III delta prime subunit